MHRNLARAALCAAVAAACVVVHPGGPAPERTRVQLPLGDETDLSRRDFSGLDLRGADLRGRNLAWSAFISTDLTGALLAEADLLDADLRRAKLVDADLRDASLLHADLRKATLDRADLSGADLRQATLRLASLAGARLEGARLDYADLRGADFSGANLTGASFAHADLTGANLPSVVGPFHSAFEMPRANRGAEAYSAWFGDDDGRVLYFGLSPFWTLWWERDEDPLADLEQPGDLLIGRFDLEAERFLEPLLVAGPTRGSVWDVLAHSSGRVCFSTYFEPMGCVDPESGEVQRFDGAGLGLNELYEGPDGHIYATRYSSDPERSGQHAPHASVVRLTPDGEVVAEHVLVSPEGGLAAAKSVAVDPATGDIWLNTDTFGANAEITHESIRLSANGRELARSSDPELHFVSFDAQGRGWFVEDRDGQLQVRIVGTGEEPTTVQLGPRKPFDFVQDVKFAADGTGVLTAWSGTVFVVRETPSGFAAEPLELEKPAACSPPDGRSLAYTAVLRGDRLYATLFCGGRVLRARLQAMP